MMHAHVPGAHVQTYCHCSFNLLSILGTSWLAIAEAWGWHTLFTSPCSTHHKAPWQDKAADRICTTKSRGSPMAQHVQPIKFLYPLGRTRIWWTRGSWTLPLIFLLDKSYLDFFSWPSTSEETFHVLFKMDPNKQDKDIDLRTWRVEKRDRDASGKRHLLTGIQWENGTFFCLLFLEHVGQYTLLLLS